MAAGFASQGTGAVDAFLFSIPYAIATLIHIDFSIILKLNDAALDRVYDTGKRIPFRHFLQECF